MYVKVPQSSLKRHILRKISKIFALVISYKYTLFFFLERATMLTCPSKNSYGVPAYKMVPHRGSYFMWEEQATFLIKDVAADGAGQEERVSWLFFLSLHTRIALPPKCQSHLLLSSLGSNLRDFSVPRSITKCLGVLKLVLWNCTLCTVIALSQKCLHLKPMISISQSLANNLTFHKHKHGLMYSH